MSFFKAYDMRGTFGVDFDLEVVYKVGKALPKVVKAKRWLVGRDCRLTSTQVRAALVQGLIEAGAEVTDLGLCTTPMVYYFTAEDDFEGSVMITASHNPPSDNGLKVSMKTALPVGYNNGLNEVEKLVLADKSQYVPNEVLVDLPSNSEYLKRYIAFQASKAPSFGALKFAVDCSNGMSGLVAHELFPGATFINDTIDGSFPAHSPNPLKDEARAQIASVVKAEHLDLGVIFDGDADRAMFVDENGGFIQPDYLIPIIMEALNERGKAIHDVRTSRGAIEALKAQGQTPVMVPVGHAFAKPILREIGAIGGGELAGHYYFRDFFGCDSGVLAALLVLGEVAKAKAEGITFSQLMTPIMGLYANSGERNYRVEDKDGAIARVLKVAAEKLPKEISRSTMDGIRIEYAEGWINIRKSNTEPYLRLIVECDTQARMQQWVKLFEAVI